VDVLGRALQLGEDREVVAGVVGLRVRDLEEHCAVGLDDKGAVGHPSSLSRWYCHRVKSVRRPVIAGVTALVLLALGGGVAYELGDALGIRSEDSDIPLESPVAAAPTETVVPRDIALITPTAGARLELARDELRAALASRPTSGTATLALEVGSGDESDESYTLQGTLDALTLVAASETGAARGIYDIASAVRDGRALTLGTVDSALPFRMVDLGAVGVTPDADAWRASDDYSHNSRAFEEVMLPDAPYIDTEKLAVAAEEFDDYVRHVLAEGYNAIAVPGLVEYLTFESVGVYDKGDEHVARAIALQRAFGPLWQYAHDVGLKVYFRTDMLTLTTPLQDYLERQFGSLDTENPALWDVYSAGLDELYESMPYIDGVLIRIGEAGSVYDLPGWDYYSALAVTTVPAVRAMLTSFTAQAERADREVIFRSWSVGVGAVGDMHTDKDSYAEVLDGIDSDKLIVSTKYTLGDFYSHLPLNDTLDVGDQRRIIEFQSRREFEAFGAFPNDLGSLYSQAITRFTAANPHIEGIWTWTQDGGPWRAGPMTLELKRGFWQLYELGTELAVRLARDPSLVPAAITADWARRWFSDDPATVAAIGQAMAASRGAITDGLYIGPYADRRVFAIGLEPPPMMWIFEWDILTGDSAVLDVIYNVSRDDLDGAIEGGQRALAAVATMRGAVEGTDAASWKSPELRDAFLGTLDYETSTLTMLADYRAMVLRQAQWHDTGSAAAYGEWRAATTRFEASSAAHEAEYAGDLDYPAYNLTAADLGIARGERDLPMAWAARILLALVVLWLAYGIAATSPRVRRLPGARAARAMVLGAVRPWRVTEVDGRATRILLVAVPVVAVVLSRGISTWFEAPAHMLTMLAGWAVFAAVLVLAARRAAVWSVVAVLGGVALLRVALQLAVIAPTGPGGYWFHFWTDPAGRSVYVTLAFALFLWFLIAGGWAVAAALGVRRAWGITLAAVGLVLAAIGAFIGSVGLERALTVWNDQLGLLPWGLSRILGITVYLDIPADTAWYAAAFGAVLLLGGLALVLPRGRAKPRPA
jgi:hypothetical protein